MIPSANVLRVNPIADLQGVIYRSGSAFEIVVIINESKVFSIQFAGTIIKPKFGKQFYWENDHWEAIR